MGEKEGGFYDNAHSTSFNEVCIISLSTSFYKG